MGFLLGLMLVVFFFNDRLSVLTSWLPNNRVLLRLQQTDAEYTPEALCELECFDLDTASVSRLKADGNVQFGNSKTQQEPKIYIVESELDERTVLMTFEARDSTSILTKVVLPGEALYCDCP
jgi:hypothetical protein